MFRILINIHVCCRGRFSASAARKDAQSAHIQYTGKVRYIKSICGYFCEKCCVRSFMCYFWSQWHNAFYSTKVFCGKNECRTNHLYLLQIVSTSLPRLQCTGNRLLPGFCFPFTHHIVLYCTGSKRHIHSQWFYKIDPIVSTHTTEEVKRQ